MLSFGRKKKAPKLSVIVITYEMEREAPRTLLSLSSGYQRGVEAEDYEVIVVDNGSRSPLSPEWIESLGPNFRTIYLDGASPSPAPAINHGVSQSRAELVGVMVDGARIVTPGVLEAALLAGRAFERPVVATLGWHLGSVDQREAGASGYDAAAEDALLAGIDWPAAGYRLFEISVFGGSSRNGWFEPITESNCLFLTRAMFDELGGYDERFDAPGGGLVNLDAYVRACAMPGATLVTLLGEGSFHQIHGGVVTNRSKAEMTQTRTAWREQYVRLRGERFRKPSLEPVYLGRLPDVALPFVAESARIALERSNDGRHPPTPG